MVEQPESERLRRIEEKNKRQGMAKKAGLTFADALRKRRVQSHMEVEENSRNL
jgi:hypothetical protein